MGVPKFTFGLVLFASQIILLALFAKYAEYPTVANVSVERHGKFYTRKFRVLFEAYYLFHFLNWKFYEKFF